ncbi:MAG TPA: RNA polymerase sigma factor [Methylomirabilota bacterium]|nr:RNA polymerase sigma factor [Methylomirabilota bacterium]
MRRSVGSDASKLDDVEPSDEALCRRVAERDEAAFDALVGRYQQRAWRLAWSILRDAEEARDISQEAFVRLYQTAETFAGRARFSTWFYRILVNLCLDHRRRRWWQIMGRNHHETQDTGSTESLIERLPADHGDPAEAVSRERLVRRLWAEVDRLAPQQRAAVLLQVQEELSTSEIAAVLQCSEATVRVHLHRALARLRKTMGRTER